MNTDAPVLLSRDVAEVMPVEYGLPTEALLRHGSMELRWYAPKGSDPQTPHDRDEIYIVIAGRGWFVHGDERVAFRQTDVLFVAANKPHRFENFTPDLALWVVLYGPVGGETP